MALQNNLSKSVGRDEIASILTPEQLSKKLIENVFDSTPLLKACRTVTMPSNPYHLGGLIYPKGKTRTVGVNMGNVSQGKRDTEDQSKYRRSVTSYNVSLKANEFYIGIPITQQSLSENIAGKKLGQRVKDGIVKGLTGDIETAAINSQVVDTDPASPINATLDNSPGVAGATFQVGATQPAGFPVNGSGGCGYLRIEKGGLWELCTYEALVNNGGQWEFQNVIRNVEDDDLCQNGANIDLAVADSIFWWSHHLTGSSNGWLYQIQNPVAGVPSNAILDGSEMDSGKINYMHFSHMMRALPKKYRNLNLSWIMADGQFQNYRDWLLNTHSEATATKIMDEYNYAPALGKNIICPLDWPDETIVLTDPKNLIVGIRDNMRVNVITNKTDASLEETGLAMLITVRGEWGFSLERSDALIMLTNLSI